MDKTFGEAAGTAISPNDGMRFRKVMIDFEGDLDAAIETAKVLGGRVAAQIGVENPVVRWYSNAYTVTPIIIDNYGTDKMVVGCWSDFKVKP